MAIIYLHGFASSGQSTKVDDLRAAFPTEAVVAPDLPPEPRAAFQLIEQIVRSLYAKGEKKILFIGTSMGGFYSWYSSAKFDAPAILVNPAIRPHESTAVWLGRNTNFATGAEFEWTQEYLDQLAEMAEWVNAHYDPKQIEIVVAMDDALLDANEIIERFHGHAVTAYPDGGHRFDRWERIVPHVDKRYQAIREQFEPEL